MPRPARGTFAEGTRESSWLRFSCGVDADRPDGVVVHLHGDGAGEIDNPDGDLSELAETANSRNMVLLAPRTPDSAEGETWWRELEPNTGWLRAFVSAHAPAGVPVWWTGYSGGAEMISYGVLAQAPDLVTGGALLMGGGGTNEETDARVSRWQGLPLQAASLPLRWAVGENDDGTTSTDGFDALRAARRGSEFWRDAGFGNVDLQVLVGRGHYDLPQASLLGRLLGE